MNIKAWAHISFAEEGSRQFRQTSIFLAVTAFVSVIVFGMEHALPHVLPKTMWVLQWATTFVFTLEYITRIWITTEKRSYVLSPLGLIDLLSILPSYLGLGYFTFLKTVRVVRTLRILRFVGMSSIPKYFKRKK